MIDMTQQQAKLLSFIRWFIQANGYSPSFDEMCEHMGYGSKSQIWRLIGCLEREGKVRRSPRYGARNVLLVEHCPHCGGAL